MHVTQLSTDSPQELLAWDEGFLDAAESGVLGAVLWFWESPHPFVVVGYGQSIPVEVHLPNAHQDQVPILRRCSGGGAVVQGPGCLNYGLVLPITDEQGPTATITATNHWVMNRNRRALQRLLPQTVAIRGHSDLAMISESGAWKFSGNAQRRRRTFLLFHGTILLDFQLPLIERYLRFPSKVPDYRESRRHLEFVANTGLTRADVRMALKTEWGADQSLGTLPLESMQAAMEARYSKAEFHSKL